MDFPEKLFVKIEGDKGDEYLTANQDAGNLLDSVDEARLAVYILTEIVRAKSAVQITLEKS